MKKIFFCLLTAGLLASCSSEESEELRVKSEECEPQEVTLKFSLYDVQPLSRAAISIADVVTRLDVWIYESGEEVTAIHQSSSDADFGTVTATLDKTKTYTLYAVGHRVASGSATLEDGVILFPDDKVTHSMYYTTTFSPSTTTSLNCLMQRIVAQFQFNTTDQKKAEVEKMQFTISNVFDRWSVTAGGTHQLDRVSTFNNVSTNQNGTITANIYAIVTDAQTLHTVTVESFNASDELVDSRTFTDVPLRNGYKTTYTGTYFTSIATTGVFSVDDWEEYDVVNF